MYDRPIKITSLSVFAQWQPFVDGPYTCSGNRSADGFDSTIVKIETDAGLVGWGEMAPLGAFYDPSFVGGARAGAALLAPLLIGLDPRQPVPLGRLMDLHLNGHPYAKSAIDMALWDLAAQSAGLPLAEALGSPSASPSDFAPMNKPDVTIWLGPLSATNLRTFMHSPFAIC